LKSTKRLNTIIINILIMKSNILLALLALLALAAALPFKEKVALHNSLQVGREEDPNVWGCTGCT
jgi:hypothetical protein